MQYPQNAPSFRTLYRILAFNNATGWTANDNGLYTISVHPNTGTDPRMHDAAGNNLPLVTLGSFRIAIGQPDSIAPAVAQTHGAADPRSGRRTYDFTVEYRDNVAIDGSTIGSWGCPRHRPGRLQSPASLVSLTAAPSPVEAAWRHTGSRRTAGGWQYTHDGSYAIAIEPNQVRDTSNNALAAGAIGTLTVHVPLPGDANGDDHVNLSDFNLLASNFGRSGRGVNTGDFTYDGVVNLADFNILASRFGTSVGPQAFGTSSIGATTKGPRMLDAVSDDVLA